MVALNIKPKKKGSNIMLETIIAIEIALLIFYYATN